MIAGEGWSVELGSCLDFLPTLPDCSVDSVVCDPPYELGFMGKSWDSSGIAYNVEVWRECLRVLKPGGHLLAFGGSRTWHRIAVAIEDAGFEVRDSIAWMYGSGFPKSLDVSKAIDKRGGSVAGFSKFRDAVKEAMSRNNVTRAELQETLGNFMLAHYLTAGSQPAVPNYRDFKIIRDTVRLGDKFDHLFAAEAEREVIGQRDVPKGHAFAGEVYGGDGSTKKIDQTKPATLEAQKWQGWGTALKPAFEPVVVARKPLVGTVAANVLEFGTGGLNIDGSRIGTGTGGTRTVAYPDIRGDNYQQGKESYVERGKVERVIKDQGRWPANVILDEFTAGLLDEQSGVSKSASGTQNYVRVDTAGVDWKNTKGMFTAGREWSAEGYGDSGGASRFFYCAKASKRDRNEGLDGMPLRKSDQRSATAAGIWEGMEAPKQNFHPTVKPTALMRYLVKLVTPPGGIVLDPFTGSGSTGKAAILEGFTFIGCELTEDYLPIIEGRLTYATEQVKIEREQADREQAESLF